MGNYYGSSVNSSSKPEKHDWDSRESERSGLASASVTGDVTGSKSQAF